jgi:hypothetical protein
MAVAIVQAGGWAEHGSGGDLCVGVRDVQLRAPTGGRLLQ